MRIKNKELRRRRHRKEQIIKAANKVVAQQFADKKTAAPKAEVKPRGEAKPKPAPKAEAKKPAKKTETPEA